MFNIFRNMFKNYDKLSMEILQSKTGEELERLIQRTNETDVLDVGAKKKLLKMINTVMSEKSRT